MSSVRVLVGTRKGAFVLTADAKREKWNVSGPHFAGWEIYHVKGSPADPNRLYASQSSGWFGQIIQRSDDGGQTWEPVDNKFTYEGIPGTHQWYDGTQHPWEFKRVWHLEPRSPIPTPCTPGSRTLRSSAPPTADEAGRSSPGCVSTAPAPAGSRERAACACTPSCSIPSIYSASSSPSSAAGAFRSDEAEPPGSPSTRGCAPSRFPIPRQRWGTVFIASPCTLRGRVCSSCRSTGDVMRSNTAGDLWHEVSGNLPTDFGFVIDVHAHEPETIYVVPIKSDSEHYPLDGKLRVYRSRTGGNEWEALTKGLPQSDCYVNVLRDAMAVDSLDSCGIYFGTTGGQVYLSPDSGDSWSPIVRDLPAVLSIEVQTLA